MQRKNKFKANSVTREIRERTQHKSGQKKLTIALERQAMRSNKSMSGGQPYRSEAAIHRDDGDQRILAQRTLELRFRLEKAEESDILSAFAVLTPNRPFGFYFSAGSRVYSAGSFVYD